MRDTGMATTSAAGRGNPSTCWSGGCAAALLAWTGSIHLHLWSQGYRHLPSIGYLFMLNFVGAVLVALVSILAVPRKYLALAAAGGALMAAGTLGALALSINVGLFGSRTPCTLRSRI